MPRSRYGPPLVYAALVSGPNLEAAHILTDAEWLAEAGGFEPRYGEFEIRRSPLSERGGRTSSAKVHKRFQTFEFENRTEGKESRASERNGPFRRTIGRRCRSEVQSSNEKSLLLLGLIAREFPQRIHSLGQFGGESGIRTHGTVSRTHAFQACALSHSAISPDPLS
jgi:hypothetical protein